MAITVEVGDLEVVLGRESLLTVSCPCEFFSDAVSVRTQTFSEEGNKDRPGVRQIVTDKLIVAILAAKQREEWVERVQPILAAVKADIEAAV